MSRIDFPINNRKEVLDKLISDGFFNSRSRVVLRRAILSSQNADSLTDADLRSHVSELRRRKFFSSISFVALPAALFYFKFNIRLVILSLIPAYFGYKLILSSRFFNGYHDFSYSMWKEAVSIHIKKTFRSKEMQSIGAAEKWGLPGSKFEGLPSSLKEWKAINEYR
jgi:hypothetical protein